MTQQNAIAGIGLTKVDGDAVTLLINATGEGKLSSTGKSMVIVSDKVKYLRSDGKEVTIQVTAYLPVAK